MPAGTHAVEIRVCGLQQGIAASRDLVEEHGESFDLVVKLPAGEYAFYCTVTGHREAGMAGTLIVG